MTWAARGAALGALVLGACGSGDAGNTPDGADAGEAITVIDAWARTTPAGASTGAVYLALTSTEDDALQGVTVEPSVARTAQLHVTMRDAAGTSTMHALEALALPAGETVVLAPNGDHVMLVDLAAPLAAGATLSATLQFAEAPDQDVTVTVRDDAP